MSMLLGELWLEIVLGFTLFLILGYRFWTKNYNYWKERNIPFIEVSFPFGAVKDVILQKKFVGLVHSDMYFKLKGHKYGGFISIRKPGLILRDPEVIKLILTKDFNHFADRGILVVDEKKDPLSANLFNLTGDKWKVLRMKLTPTFTSGKMRLMFELMSACAKAFQKSLIEHAEKGEVVELKDFTARFGTDVIGSCAFGLDIDSINHPDNAFRKISKDIFTASFPALIRSMLNSIIPGFNKIFQFKVTPKEREEFFFKIVGDTVAYREKNNIKRNDFLDLLIDIKNKGHVEDDSHNFKNTKHDDNETFKINNLPDINMTNELITAQCFVFFVAGFETSSTTLSFCLYELALNKDIHDRLQDEIDRVLEKYNGEITYDALKEMTYMDRVVQESLRKYSPVGALLRECTQDYKLPNSAVYIEKGTRLLVPLYGIHYDPEYYPDPERFDPDRFTEEMKASRPHYTWMPFGEGPRICIGMRFGLLQIKMGLATLLSEFNFDRAPETMVPMVLNRRSFTASPKDGIKLKITKRNK